MLTRLQEFQREGNIEASVLELHDIFNRFLKEKGKPKKLDFLTYVSFTAVGDLRLTKSRQAEGNINLGELGERHVQVFSYPKFLSDDVVRVIIDTEKDHAYDTGFQIGSGWKNSYCVGVKDGVEMSYRSYLGEEDLTTLANIFDFFKQ